MQIVERLQIELAALDGIREKSRVVRFLAGASLPRLDLGELQKAGGCEWADRFL